MPDWLPLAVLACCQPDAARVVVRRHAHGQPLSHGDLVARVDRWATAFARHPECTHWAVFVVEPFDFAAAVLAAWHAGKTVVLPGDDLPGTVQALRRAGYGLAGDLPGAVRAASDVDAAPHARDPIDLHQAGLTLFTSGSQGEPEAIDKRLFQLVSEVDALEQAFGAMLAGTDGPPTVWTTVSHQHIYGLLFSVLWPLSAGRALAPRRLLYPEDLAACLGPCSSVLVATPAHLKRLGDQLDWREARQGLSAVFSSGGPLPFEVAGQVKATLGHVPIEVFGSSETGGIAWRQCAVDAQTPWLAFEDVQWQRTDDGCLSVRSPRLPDAQWWVTSDLIEPAGMGSFRLLGRADRIVKIEEKRVSLGAIERLLLATPWVREARALVMDTPIGARVAVVAVPTALGAEQAEKGRRVLSELLRIALAGELEAMALPRRWRFVAALPVNAQGKTTQALLAALFGPDAKASTGALPASVPIWPEMPAVQWHERGETHALATLDIHAGLSVFNGHFPVAPILPGVAQLDWALALGRECFALPAHFVRLEALKFVRPVSPGTALKLALQFKPRLADATLCSLGFKLYSHDPDTAELRDHASGRAVWSHEAEGAHA